MHVANIHTDNGRTFEIHTNGYSYEVKGFRVNTFSGQARTVFGCRDDRDCFRTAKHLVRKWKAPNLGDPAKWKLELIGYPGRGKLAIIGGDTVGKRATINGMPVVLTKDGWRRC